MDQGHTAASRGGARSGRIRALACGAIGVIAIAVFAFLFGRVPVSEHDANRQANNSPESHKERELPSENQTEQNRTHSLSSPNRVGVSPGKPISAPTALLQTPSLHRLIEDLIGDVIGNDSIRSDPQGFRERLAARAKAHFPPELAQSAVAFLNRYVDYLESLDSLNLSSAKSDVAALRSLFEARKALRESFFAPEEYKALFAREDRLDRYTIARMEIEANAKLSAEERDHALANAANELTPDERAERKSWQLHLTAQSQTALFDAKQTSDEERFDARKTEYGEAAAQRLAELDRAQREWDARLTQYEQALRATREGAMTEAQLTALRDRMFNEQERLRLDTALAMRRRKS